MLQATIEKRASSVLRVFQSKDQIKGFYNKIIRFYDLLSDRSEAPIRKAGLGLLKPCPGESIMEIGFGTGHSLVAIAKAVGPEGKVFGLDLSDQMLKLAKANLAMAGLLDRARLRCGDAEEMPYASDTMDAVFMSFTLELFDTPEIPKVLRECKRLLCPGGRVVVGMSKDKFKSATACHQGVRSSDCFGSSNVNSAPSQTLLVTATRPRCASTTALTRLRPSPSPRCDRLLSPR